MRHTRLAVGLLVQVGGWVAAAHWAAVALH